MDTLTSRILALLENQQGLHLTNIRLTKLHGDASNRVYYRIIDPVKSTSWILMQLPQGAGSVSEEITNLKEKSREIPFINIQKFLLSKALPVPKILAYDETDGLMVLEDLGDETLEKRLLCTATDEWEIWYRQAIDLLVKFQKIDKDSRCIACHRSFDETLLNWEFDHFIKYGIEVRTGCKIPLDDLKEMRKGMHSITHALVQLPQTIVHRDFQSRNLMIHPKDQTLRLLDFQDALLGPLPYDVVALLRDSYISLHWTTVTNLINYYLDTRETTIREKQDRSFLVKMFDFMTIQRKLKDAGRFVYIDQVKKNPSFLPHIPNSLKYVREAFERQPELQNLFQTLKKYVPEFN